LATVRYNVPRQEGRENEKYLISEYLYRNRSLFIIWIINYSYYHCITLPFLLSLFIIVSENSPYLYLKTGLNLFSLIKLAVRHYFFVIVNSRYNSLSSGDKSN
jgi:hypothetical protein